MQERVGRRSSFSKGYCLNRMEYVERKDEVREKEQVAQGQYVVSDTRCPALSDCELE